MVFGFVNKHLGTMSNLCAMLHILLYCLSACRFGNVVLQSKQIGCLG